MEVKVYGVHIKQENSLKDIMNEEFVKFTEEHKAVLVLNGKNPVRYLASFILPTREKQRLFADELAKRGIKADSDATPSYVERGYFEKYLKGKWKEG